MAFTPQALADGQLPASLATIYSSTANPGTYLKEITLYNNSANNQIILLFVNRTGTNRLWKRFELAQDESAEVLTNGQTMFLGPSDVLLGQTSDANEVDFTISGVEEEA